MAAERPPAAVALVEADAVSHGGVLSMIGSRAVRERLALLWLQLLDEALDAGQRARP